MSPELWVILAVTTVSFFVKAITGFGGPLLAIPVLAPLLGVEHAVVALSLANLTSNALLIWQNRAGAPTTRRLLVRILTAGAVAAVLGTVLLVHLDDRILYGVLAVSVLGYVALAFAKPDLRIRPETGLRMAAPVGVLGGFIHGSTANSGTVFGTFLHSLALSRPEFVFAITTIFFVLSVLQVGTLVSLGAFGDGRWLQALVAILPIFAVTPLGTRVAGRLNARTFGRVVLVMLAVAGVRLVFGAFGV